MTVLVVGGGGREHALVWHLRRAHPDLVLLAAPGNPGIAAEGARCVPWPTADVEQLADAALSEEVDLVVVGPEAPLVAGLGDALAARRIPCFGPTAAAARLEGSKIDAKEFMLRTGVPTARFLACDTPEEARTAVARLGVPCVVKADGLAGGKGAFVCRSRELASEVIDRLLVERRLGPAGARVVVEEFLSGAEATVMAMTDGERWRLLPPVRDHKRLEDGDRGPNTGGMGAIAPADDVAPSLLAEIESTIVAPTLQGLAEEGRPFRGALYAGVMLTDEGPMVIEFNCRFGDPEAEAVLPLVASDLLDLFAAAAAGELARVPLAVRPGAAHAVVLAARGYPDNPVTGDRIDGVAPGDGAGGLSGSGEGALVFQAGTAVRDHGLVTAGGRALVVTGCAATPAAARAEAERRVREIHFAGMQYRRDIGETARPAVAGAPAGRPA